MHFPGEHGPKSPTIPPNPSHADLAVRNPKNNWFFSSRSFTNHECGCQKLCHESHWDQSDPLAPWLRVLAALLACHSASSFFSHLLHLFQRLLTEFLFKISLDNFIFLVVIAFIQCFFSLRLYWTKSSSLILFRLATVRRSANVFSNFAIRSSSWYFSFFTYYDVALTYFGLGSMHQGKLCLKICVRNSSDLDQDPSAFQHTQQGWMRYSKRLASETSCILLYAIDMSEKLPWLTSRSSCFLAYDTMWMRYSGGWRQRQAAS